MMAIVIFIWRHRTAYLKTRGSSGALDLHQNANLKWSCDLHRMAESTLRGRSTIEARSPQRNQHRWIGIKMHDSGRDLHQMAKSTAGGKSTIKVRSPRDRGHDQALLWSDQSGNQDHNHERLMATIKTNRQPIEDQTVRKNRAKFPFKKTMYPSLFLNF